jgi:hypothetical protein
MREAWLTGWYSSELKIGGEGAKAVGDAVTHDARYPRSSQAISQSFCLVRTSSGGDQQKKFKP